MTSLSNFLQVWVKTSGFLAYEFFKGFLLLYPIFCITSDCFLQVQVAFKVWFEDIPISHEDPAETNVEEILTTLATASPNGSLIADSTIEQVPQEERFVEVLSALHEDQIDINAGLQLNIEEILRHWSELERSPLHEDDLSELEESLEQID